MCSSLPSLPFACFTLCIYLQVLQIYIYIYYLNTISLLPSTLTYFDHPFILPIYPFSIYLHLPFTYMYHLYICMQRRRSSIITDEYLMYICTYIDSWSRPPPRPSPEYRRRVLWYYILICYLKRHKIEVSNITHSHYFIFHF